jgi:hypothetical protein
MNLFKFLVIVLCLTFLGIIPLSMKSYGWGEPLTLTVTPTNTPLDTPTATPTIVPFTVSGTVTYQGTGQHNLYVFMTDNSGGFYLSSPLLNNGSFFFTASPNNIQGFLLWACYDFSGNGIQLTPNWNGYGLPVQQGNGEALTNSGDVICNIGYYGDCMSIGPGGGTHYTSNASVTILFGGKTGAQSGTICTE